MVTIGDPGIGRTTGDVEVWRFPGVSGDWRIGDRVLIARVGDAVVALSFGVVGAAAGAAAAAAACRRAALRLRIAVAESCSARLMRSRCFSKSTARSSIAHTNTTTQAEHVLGARQLQILTIVVFQIKIFKLVDALFERIFELLDALYIVIFRRCFNRFDRFVH